MTDNLTFSNIEIISQKGFLYLNNSREVVLRKLLDRELIDREYYQKKMQQWVKEFEEGNRGKSGGDYCATQATYLGDKSLSLAFGRFFSTWLLRSKD